jgi:hypothetical protein
MRHGGCQVQHDQKKKDPTEIPILRYGPNNNFSKFKEALSYQALKQFGYIGCLTKLGEYYNREPPDQDDYDLTPQGDPDGMNRFVSPQATRGNEDEPIKIVCKDCGVRREAEERPVKGQVFRLWTTQALYLVS